MSVWYSAEGWDALQAEIAELRADVARLEAENARLAQEVEDLWGVCHMLPTEHESLCEVCGTCFDCVGDIPCELCTG
jgi:predicted nuclease with TOPRIM domain